MSVHVPHDIKVMIAKRVRDPATIASLKCSSREWKAAVDDAHLTGSYARGTGRYQRVFPKKAFLACSTHIIVASDTDRVVGSTEEAEHSTILAKMMRVAYNTNSLLASFRSLTDSNTVKDAFDLDLVTADSRHIVASALYRWRKEFHARVIRLIRLWTRTDPRYAATLPLVRRRRKAYSRAEEKAHKDRVMDAILVQLLAKFRCDDPTRERVDSTGKLIDLHWRIRKLVDCQFDMYL